MPKTYQLLLTDNVESLGIVGDVVTVRAGYARNYLMPRSLATEPSEDKIRALAQRRAEAEKMLSELRSHREQMVEKLEGFEVTLERSCNDQGLLYGSVTQQDIATALNTAGFTVRPRDVRITQTIKRVDHYDVTIRPDLDLEASIKLHVKADRPLELKKDEPVEAPAPAPADVAAAPDAPAPAAPEAPKESKAGKSGKSKKGAAEEPAEGAKPKTGWGAVVNDPVLDIPKPRGKRR